MRFVLLFLVGGGFLVWKGCQEYRVSSGTSDTPVSMELSEIEGGTPPGNNHLALGAHVAVYGECIYEYSAGKFSTGEPKPSAKVNHAYYPVISENHPFLKALGALAEEHGGLEKVPEDAELPKLDKISVLVKTERFKTIGSIPQGMSNEAGVKGLLINRIDGLEDKEARLLRGSFPSLDVAQVLILEQDRKPSSVVFSFGMIVLGVVIILASLASLRGGRRQAA